MTALSKGALGLALAGALAAASSALAQATAPSGPATAPVVFAGDHGFAQALTDALAAGDLRTALHLLESRPDIAATAAGVRLRAELLTRLGRASEAIALLEGHLAQDSADAQARFQVAEIHFAARLDRSATLAYRLALSGRLDPARRRIAESRLADIEARRDLRISLSASIAPDSNLNSATSASTVDLYGLPFILSDDARRRAGVAAALTIGVERRLPLSDQYALIGGGGLSLLDASNRSFDQRQISLYAGPELLLTRETRIGLAATYRDIDFGGADLETWRGLQLNVQTYPDPRTRWEGSIHLDRIHSQRAAGLSGRSYGGQASRTRFLGPSALWRAGVALDAHDLAGSQASYHEGQFSAGRLLPLPFSSLGYVEPYGRARSFDQRSAVFGVRRVDRELGVSLRVSKRDWSFRNAFPYVQAIVSRSSSNVALGRYSRQRIEFGFTRDF